MEDTLVSIRVAKLAKDKGLSIATTYYYDFSGSVESLNRINKTNWNKYLDSIYSAPTQSLLAKWLREKYHLYVTVLPYKIVEFGDEIELCYNYIITNLDENLNICLNAEDLGTSEKNFNSPEEALDEGLYQALLLIK